MKDQEFRRKKLMHDVQKEVSRKDCKKCGENDWKIVPLFEFGETEYPSTVQFLCRKCGFHSTFMSTKNRETDEYSEILKKKGFKKADKTMADKLLA